MNFGNEVGGYIVNGTVSENTEGEYIYIGTRGCTVIYYIIVNEICNNRVISFKIDNRIDSGYLPLILNNNKR